MTSREHPEMRASLAVSHVPTRRPPLLWTAGALVAVLVLVFNLLFWARFVAQQPAPRAYFAQTDFVSWFAAAQQLAAGQASQIYDVDAHQAAENALIAPYPQLAGGLLYHYWPVLAGLLLPTVTWPTEAAFAAWILICGAAFAAALIILLRGLAFPARDGWVFAVAAAGFLPLIWDLEWDRRARCSACR